MTSKLVLLATAGILFCTSATAGLVTYRAHGPINQIIDFSETDSSTTDSFDWVDVPNASLRLIIPQGPTQIVMARFTAEASCYGPISGTVCSARILAGKIEMFPNSGGDFGFATATVANTASYTGAAMGRSIALGPGTYTIKVQYLTTNINDTFTLDDWHLNVQTADYGVAPGTAPDKADPGSHPIVSHSP